MCNENHTIDGWPHDVPLNYDLSVPTMNLRYVLREWSVCDICRSIGQYQYMPQSMKEKLGEKVFFKYIHNVSRIYNTQYAKSLS